MAKRAIILFLSLFLWTHSWAQDELVFRSLFTGEVLKENEGVKVEIKHQYLARSPLYLVDLNGNDRREGLNFIYKDGTYWFELYDFKREKLFEYKFQSLGAKAQVHRVRLVEISKNIKALVFYFFEGVTSYVESTATGRLYVLSFENGELKDLKMNRGAPYWYEKKDHLGRYQRRRYEMNVVDIDEDNVKEVITSSGKINHIMRYVGKGVWKYSNL